MYMVNWKVHLSVSHTLCICSGMNSASPFKRRILGFRYQMICQLSYRELVGERGHKLEFKIVLVVYCNNSYAENIVCLNRLRKMVNFKLTVEHLSSSLHKLNKESKGLQKNAYWEVKKYILQVVFVFAVLKCNTKETLPSSVLFSW